MIGGSQSYEVRGLLRNLNTNNSQEYNTTINKCYTILHRTTNQKQFEKNLQGENSHFLLLVRYI